MRPPALGAEAGLTLDLESAGSLAEGGTGDAAAAAGEAGVAGLAVRLLVGLLLTSFAGAGPQGVGSPGLSRTVAWGAAVLSALAALGAGFQRAGCVADGLPWYQIATWALMAAAFGGSVWLLLRHPRGVAEGLVRG